MGTEVENYDEFLKQNSEESFSVRIPIAKSCLVKIKSRTLHIELLQDISPDTSPGNPLGILDLQRVSSISASSKRDPLV